MQAVVNHNKLTVCLRIESGCLGKHGAAQIKDFCLFAAKHTQHYYSDDIIWQYQPKEDKLLPEMDFYVKNKRLTRQQAQRYLKVATSIETLTQLEDNIQLKLIELVEQFRALAR